MFSASSVSNLLTRITSARRAALYFVFVLLSTYTVVPMLIALVSGSADHFIELSVVSAVAALFVYLGSLVTLFDRVFSGKAPRIVVDPYSFIAVAWFAFVAFVLVAWFTAERIPLLASLSGADPDTIAYLRERFLKDREGWQSSFVYINAVLAGALIPYSLALMFLHSTKHRWLAFVFFLIYCISFVEKAFFLKAVLPLLYLVAQRRIRIPLSPAKLALAMVGMLLTITLFSGVGAADEASGEAFFSAAYLPQGPLSHLLWRSVAIPLVTAADAIRVLNDEFGGRVLWGATSSFLAAVLGQQRIEFERLVFAAQWGQNETGTGSSNSVYITEAFVNFGWIGVVLFSLFVGLVLRMFARSRDEAFRSLWMLFFLGVYTAGVVGLMLSNGFALLFALNLFVRFKWRRSAKSRSTASPRREHQANLVRGTVPFTPTNPHH